MLDARIINEMQQRLWRIQELAREIEDVPNIPQDVWTMRGIDKKCQEIQAHCQWIASYLVAPPPGPGTGPGWGPGWGPGTGPGWGSGY